VSFTLPSPAVLFAGLIFGTIGLAAFIYGKKTTRWQPMLIGFILMAFPYFIDITWLLYAVGCALTAALFVFRD
jgi:hypothetical protein